MKRLLLLLLLFSSVSQAQIVNIPDANFKAKLLEASSANTIAHGGSGMGYIKIDSNNDGEIQVSEALAVKSLNVNNSNISNLEGIKAFANLGTLRCVYNTLISLDVSGMVNLTSLDCYQNTLMTSLNVTGCSSLLSCKTYDCAITSLDVSNLAYLETLQAGSNQLNSVNLSGCTEMYQLYLGDNQLNSLDISDCTKLHYLRANNNQLTNLDVSNLGLETPLDVIDVSYNQLTSLIVNNTEIRYGYGLICSNNQLQALDLSTARIDNITAQNNLLQSITLPQSGDVLSIYVANNQLITLDFSNVHFYSSSYMVDAGHNSLTDLNFPNDCKISQIKLNDNQLVSLDVTKVNGLSMLDISNNPELESVFAKNGSNEGIVSIGNTNPTFICADESQLQIVQENFASTVVSPYCIFTPGGNYNTITGNVTFDADNNGCDPTDPDQPYVKLDLTSGNNNYAVFTSPDGTYNNFGQTGTFNVSVAMENASLFTITPLLAAIIFGNNNNNITTQDFCITSNGIQNDLETVIVPLLPACPGFDATYKIIYKNKGNQVLSGSVDFTYQENELDFINASVVPDAQSSGILSWNFSNLYPLESRSINVRLNVNSPMEAPAVNIGDQLNFSVQANPLAGDITPEDNAFSIKQTVIGSFDPNDITCLEGEHVNPTEIGKYLHYNINFENTGSAAAENIVIKDIIDLTKYDISSLQILNASHPVTTRITNDKAEFIFEGINLGASEHGNVTFKIKTKNTLVTGNSVSQKADIYFDYNFPVATNVAMTTFDTLGTDNPVPDNEISFYPNPVSDMLNVKSVENIRRIDLYDLRGRLLQTVSESNTIKFAEIPSGIYLIQAFTDAGSKSEKIIKR